MKVTWVPSILWTIPVLVVSSIPLTLKWLARPSFYCYYMYIFLLVLLSSSRTTLVIWLLKFSPPWVKPPSLINSTPGYLFIGWMNFNLSLTLLVEVHSPSDGYFDILGINKINSISIVGWKPTQKTSDFNSLILDVIHIP